MRGRSASAMARNLACAVRVGAYGGPEVLRYEALDLSQQRRPEPGEVLIRNSFAGVNFIDTYYRTGLYKDATKPLPFISGLEGAGAVLAVGDNVDPSWVGRRVAFVRSKEGSYATFSMADINDLYQIPDGVKDDTAAAVMLQGCTAHYLCNDCFDAKAGTTVVIHAAAGGTGLLLSQMCVTKGATVIGICGNAEKAETAKTVGKATHVVNYGETPDWAAEVRKLAPPGVHAVFDGVGAATFEGSLSVLRRRGSMVSFGNASGPVPAVSPLTLTKHGSVTLQRPALGDFMDRESGEAQRRVAAVLDLVRKGDLNVTIGKRFMLRDAQKAHEALESKATTGKILLDCTE